MFATAAKNSSTTATNRVSSVATSELADGPAARRFPDVSFGVRLVLSDVSNACHVQFTFVLSTFVPRAHAKYTRPSGIPPA